MTVTITSSLRVGLVAGTGAQISAPVVPSITTDDIYNPANASQTLTEMISGLSSAKLVGTGTITGTTVGNTSLYTVPANTAFIPTNLIFELTDVSGSGAAPAVNVGYTGSFKELLDSTRNTQFVLSSADVFAAGSGYAPSDSLTLSGGTFMVQSTMTVATTRLVSLALNAPGTIYAPGDTVTLAGGTASTKAILTVSTCKLVSATINAGGTGYGNAQTFTVTVAGGTQTSTAQISVTSDAGGIVTTVNSVTQAGSYSVLPTLTGNAVTGGTGTGLTLDLVFGINTFTINTPGVYTANTTTFTQFSTSGSGTGATFQTALFGVNTATVNTAGNYSVLPSNHVSTTTGGSGTGCTLDANWTITSSIFDGITAENQLLSITNFATTAGSNGVDYKAIPASSVLKARIDTASTYTTFVLKLYVFGFEVSA